MKKLVTYLPLLAVLVSSLSFVSCQKEESIKPVQPDTRNARLGITEPLNTQTYLLTKQNGVEISRKSNGTITKVTYTPNYYITYQNETSGDPGYSRTKATAYSGGAITQVTWYFFKDGRLSKSISTQYHPHTGAEIKTVQHTYMFDAQGKLQRRFVETNSQQRIEFLYNLEGSLTKVIEYDAQGILTKTTQFYYTANALKDKYGFYPDITGADMDHFFQVLGTFFNKLPTSRLINYTNPNITDSYWSFEYELNAYGYPLTRRAYKNIFSVPQLEETRTYGYGKFDVEQ